MLDMADNHRAIFATMSTPHILNGHGLARPQTLHGTKSFSRMDSSQPKPLAKSRASTLQNGTRPDTRASERLDTPAVEDSSQFQTGDIFEPESAHPSEGLGGDGSLADETKDLPEDFDDLPIELISMTDRYQQYDCGNLLLITNAFPQIYRVSYCQSPYGAAFDREAFRYVSRVLLESRGTYFNAH